MTKSKRIIIDTNLWVSFLISNSFKGLDNLILKGDIKLILSNELIKELIEVLQRPKFKKHFTPKTIESTLVFLELYGEIIDVTSNTTLCRDEKDNFLLNLSIDAEADYLLTGDKDLLILEFINNTKIITLSDFLKINS